MSSDLFKLMKTVDLNQYWKRKANDIKSAQTEGFADLFKLSGLNKEKDFRASNWSNIDFSGCDLGGFDFAGSNLRNCNFKNAKIHGACFDKAEIGETNLRSAKDWNQYRNNWKRNPNPVSDLCLPPFSVFQDAPFAPELVVIPSGKFNMGSSDGKGRDNECPQHEVTIDYRLAVGRFAVTFEEWDFYVSRHKDAYKPKDEGWGRERRPVINVSWDNAQDYLTWLSETTGEHYRLLSEAEWEYACRAGTDTEYSFGDSISRKQAQYSDNGYGSANKTVPVGSFEPNQFGLYDMHGNVREWCEDYWHRTYKGAPVDGSAWIGDSDDKRYNVLRGGSWDLDPEYLRARFRYLSILFNGSYTVGFRVARTLASNPAQ